MLTKGQITDKAIKELSWSGCEVWRNNNIAIRGRKFIGRKGVPDIVGFHKIHGTAVYCEVKTESDRLSEEQIAFMDAAKAAGCIVLMAVDDNGYQLIEYKQD